MPSGVQSEQQNGANLSMTVDVRAADVRKQLQTMLQSQMFASSPRLSRLLRYIVEQALASRPDRLREAMIGKEVFERSEAFNPRTDSIVRVEARRLRSKLAAYYAGPGRTDNILILIPRREYTPQFVRRTRNQDLGLHNATVLQQVAAASLQTLLIEQDPARACEFQDLLAGFGFPAPVLLHSADKALELVAAGNIHLVLIGGGQTGEAACELLCEAIQGMGGTIVLRIDGGHRQLTEDGSGNGARGGCLSLAELRCILALLQIVPRAYSRVNGAHA